MSKNQELEERLKERDVRPTAIRLLVLNEMMKMEQAFSLMDLESKLETIDKSTIFRTITLFHDKMLLHSIDDGSGSIKYSMCSRHCTCAGEAAHVHFSCRLCHKIYCLKNIAIPRLNLPKGFEYESANFVLKGVCENCSKIVD